VFRAPLAAHGHCHPPRAPPEPVPSPIRTELERRAPRPLTD